MTSYLTPEQHAQLLKPINPARVSKDGKGYSHVEAYEIRAHLNRVIGFGRWSADLTDLSLVFEDVKDGKTTVCYRATMRLTVCAPDGTPLATYTEAATGEAKNQPHRGDAHDLAIKTAESQAFKRCAVNLGDNFGLSLYAKGSLRPLVGRTLVTPEPPSAGPRTATPKQPVAAEAIDSHITEPLPKEGEPAEDQRETNTATPPPQAPPAAPKDTDREQKVADWRTRLLAGPPKGKPAAPWFARFQVEAAQGGFLNALVEDRDENVVSVGAMLNAEQRRARGAA